MKKRRIILTAALGLMLVAAPAFAAVEWADLSMADAIKRAKAEKKHIVIDFLTVWCSPCKTMDEGTYTNAEVVTLLSDAIPLRFDSEKGAGIEVTKKYRIRNWPTTLVIGPDGTEVDRHIGYLDAANFVTVIGGYVKGIETVAYYKEKVEQNPADAESWKILGQKHLDANRFEEAREAVGTYFELVPDVAGEERAELMSTLADLNYQSGTYAEAIEIYQKIIHEFKDTEWHDRSLTRMARSYNKQGEPNKCVASYLEYVNRHPDDPKACNSFAWFSATKGVGHKEALPVALKAVELSNRHYGYLDTLAELYYAMGRFDDAIQIGKEALEQEPEDQYLVDQVKKFELAKKEAEDQAKN